MAQEVSRTKVLGRLACLVLSKILGIGSAERHWKLVKEVKSGQRVKISTEKIDKQVHIYGVNGQAKSQIQAKVRSPRVLRIMQGPNLTLRFQETIHEGPGVGG